MRHRSGLADLALRRCRLCGCGEFAFCAARHQGAPSWTRPHEAGVQHIVYTSFFGAGPTCTFTLGRDHHATEQRIRDSGMVFTFLRDNFYLDFLPMLTGEDGIICGPAGDGVMAAVAKEFAKEPQL